MTEAHAARIASEGWTIVEDAIEPDLVDALVRAIDRLHGSLAVQPAKNLFEGLATLRVYNLLARDPIFERVPVHDAVLPIVEKVLDQGCLVSSLSSITILPGERAQPIHADDQLIPLPKPHVPLVCNSMWALTDFTEENGATRLVPRTHLADANPELTLDERNDFSFVIFPPRAPGENERSLRSRVEGEKSIAAVMKKGSVLVWNGSLWHGGGANRTGERRIGLAMNYCVGWMRQQENQQLGIPLDVARGFSPRLRKLVGFGLYRRLLGHIDLCSPVDLLDGTGPRRVVGEP